MKTINVSEASGQTLDWLVVKCEGFGVEFNHQYTAHHKFDGWWQCGPFHWQPLKDYSTDWAHGGVIVDREGITVGPYYEKSDRVPNSWSAYIGWDHVEHDPLYESDGPTPLIAAMRCYCVSKLGNVVEVPDELA